MMTTSNHRFVRQTALTAAVLVAGLLHASCGMDDVQVPPLSGPSELAFSLKLDVNPDVLTADGFSTALVVATARGPNGEALAGRQILFAISSPSRDFADIGTLYNAAQTSRLRAAEATAVTGADGVAQVIYTVPARTDATADTSVNVEARPVGTDFNGQLYRTVAIELKSAEPRLFPVVDAGTLKCNFVVEAPLGDSTCTGSGSAATCTIKRGSQVLFQDTSTSGPAPVTIVRYEWFFGDGTGVNYDIDQNHVFRSSGTFTVTHRVTDSTGAQDACAATINVQ
jgi:hypothetical protein